MTRTTNSPDQTQHQDMGDAERAFCGGLDRLLTIGSYYQPSHERFQAVARECAQSLLEVIRGRPKLELFVTAEGLMLDKGHLSQSAVEARRLFDLLDPLHIALVEIDATATSDHLHLALASLKKARNAISGSRTYQEIEIKGLPDTVRILNRSLFLKTHTEAHPQPKPPPRRKAPEVTFFEHNMISELLMSNSPAAQKLEKEFVGIIQGIMATADPTRLKTGSDGESAPDQWLPEETLEAIEKVLEALAGTGSDLMNLQHLIAQAQSALEVTGDPELVDLVFARLQKDSRKLARKRVQPKMIGKDQKGTRNDSRKKLIMSQQEMREIVDNLAPVYGPHPDPRDQAGGDCLAICVQLMDLAPTEELVSGIEETILRILTRPKVTAQLRLDVVNTCRALLMHLPDEVLDRTWPMVWGPLHRSHPDLMADLWWEIWQELNARGRDRAWPFLVNDLLLGMTGPRRIEFLLLLEAVSQVGALGNHDIIVRLENLPAMLEKNVAVSIFQPPAPLLYSVHKVLVGSSLSGVFGPLLHDHLVRQAPHKLSAVLLEVMDEYLPINRAIYHAILDQGVEETIHSALAELAPEILIEALSDLHWDYMEEDWVVPAIEWLGRLGRESAIGVLQEITQEKKYMVLASWPLQAREAADLALGQLKERLHYRGKPGGSPDKSIAPPPPPSHTEAPRQEVHS
jgi:hypothetical protein|nr:hypothetical protein [Candidatus Krumholzibacteria bacterium]